MARAGITYHHVEQAAIQLAAQSKIPTIETIRQILKTGSSTTIANHLRTWKAKQSDVQRIATKEKIPENLIAFIKDLWEQVMREADEQIAQVQQSATQETAELKQQLHTVTQENQQLQQQYHQAQHTLQKMVNEQLVQEQAIMRFQNEVTTLQTEIKGLNDCLTEKQARLLELQTLHQQVQANLEHYRDAARAQRLQEQQQHEHQIKYLEQLTQQYLQDNNQLKQQSVSVQDRFDQLFKDHTELQHTYQAIMVDFNVIKSDLRFTTEQLTNTLRSEQDLAVKYQAEHEAREAQQKSLVDFQSQVALFTQKLLETEQQIEKLTQQNQLLVQDKWQLGQETARLKGQLNQLLAST